MRLQILVSTMNQKDHSIIQNMNISTDAIIINQCDKHNQYIFDYEEHEVIWLNSQSKGLSISRNLALDLASKEICIIADDDLVYFDDYAEKICESFNNNPEYDILAFQVEGVEKKFKDYSNITKELKKLTSMKVSSVEIAFRLDQIRKKEIKFDELFGAGAKYQMGEESIFLSRCLDAGLRIKYIPIKIAKLHLGNSTWFKGFTEDYFISKGAQFTAMSKNLSIFYIIQFAIRKYKLYAEYHTILRSFLYMMKGRKKYLFNDNHEST